MRALADGKTGKLAINGHPLDWQYISREAEISRCTWLKRFRELAAAGLAGSERPRVLRVIAGRKRVVLGRACYFVRRQATAAEVAENPPILLKSTTSTVEEVDPQVFQTHQGDGVRSGVLGSERGSVSESGQQNHHHHTHNDDSIIASLSESKPENQTYNLARLRAKAEVILLQEHNEELVGIALDRIIDRIVAKGNPIGSHRYLLTAFVNLVASEEWEEIFDDFQNRQRRREKFMPGFILSQYSQEPDEKLTAMVREGIDRKNKAGQRPERLAGKSSESVETLAGDKNC